MFKIHKKQFDTGDGKIIEIETGKLARQAHGSCVVKVGKTMILASVVSNYDAKEGVDFLPLSVRTSFQTVMLDWLLQLR